MNFTDELFLLVLPVLFLLYYILPLIVRPYVLLLFSLAFYVCWGPEKLPFLLAAVLVTWLLGLVIGRRKEKAKVTKTKKAGKTALVIGIILLLLGLIYAKVGGMFLSGNIIVPLGVSYYTFMLMGYLMDVYYGRVKAEKNPLHLLAFAAFFPGILQGPLSRYKDLSPQLKAGHRFDYQKVAYGFQLMIYGYFKKLVIADRLAQYTTPVFADYQKYSGIVILVGLIFRSVQLYCDFSGYMDIAGGIAEIFGISLAKNFARPFFAKSAAEFWRKWHATLGTWFKDYVYMPLMTSKWVMQCSKIVKKIGGRRAGKATMTIIPTYIVWLLTGLWHGTGVDYILWGVYWGTLIVISAVFAPEIAKLTKALRINTQAASWRVFQMVRTFILFTIGRWITVGDPIGVARQMFSHFRIGELFDGTLYTIGMDRPNFILAMASLSIVWWISLHQEKGSVREQIASFNIVFRWMIYYGAILAVVIFGIYGLNYDASSFIYMKF